MNRNLIGKEYPFITYEVGREKIREYARATLAKNPLYFDPEFARRSRYGTIAAPPTFAAVYCAQVLPMVFTDSELGMNVPRVIHGEQEFRFRANFAVGRALTANRLRSRNFGRHSVTIGSKDSE